MASDVLIMICPMWGTCLPPMGLAYLAAYLEKKGIPCEVLDLNITLYDAARPEQKSLWKMENFHAWTKEDAFGAIRSVFAKEITKWAQHIVAKGFRTVGFSINGANILFSIEIAKELKRKKPDISIVFGGPSCNFLHDDSRMPFRFLASSLSGKALLEEGLVDFIVLGEGEASFYEIVAANRLGLPVNRPGVVAGPVRDRSGIVRPIFFESLDSLPFPAWEKLPLEKYDEKEELPILFNRGCINKCAFCNDWSLWGGRFRSRSARNIFEEIQINQDRFKRKGLRSNDLVFNGNLEILDELADRIIESGLEVHWSAQGVVRADMKVELLQKLKKAGLATIVYGVESLADNVLKKMRKPFTFEEIHRVLKRTKAAGINAWINLIVGFPGETEEDLRTTRERLGNIRDCVDAISSLSPCNITAATELEMFPERFGVAVSEGSTGCESWKTTDGTNTFEIRKRNVQEMFRFLQGVGIPVHFVGIYDDSKLSQMEPVFPSQARTVKKSRGFFWGRVLRFPALVLLLAGHLFLVVYLQLVKVLRKTVMFPGG